MELDVAIATVKSYLPMLPNLGPKVNEAIALVMVAAMGYEEHTWHYQYEVRDASGHPIWLDGFPSSITRQRRFRDPEGDYEYGNWKPQQGTRHLHPLVVKDTTND